MIREAENVTRILALLPWYLGSGIFLVRFEKDARFWGILQSLVLEPEVSHLS